MPANDLVLLDSIIDKHKSDFGVGLDKSELFEIFCFDQILKNYDLSYEELKYGHVDGGDDGGIDGLFLLLDDNLITELVDVKSIRRNPELQVVIVTCKYGTQFKQIPINNLISSLLDLFDLSKSSDEIFYPFEDSIIEFRELFRKLYVELAEKNPALSFRMFYASRGETKDINPNVTSRATELEAKLSNLFSRVETSVAFLGASELLQLARKQKSYALRIRFVENVISRAKTNYIILTTLSDYYRFVTDEDGQLRRYLFESNVRDYLGASNSVISDIKDSLESSLDKENADFWWFSNGITLLASNALIAGKELSLENVQIVNGLQTTNAIYEHFHQTRKQGDERALLLKIIITDNEDVRGRIIKATNFQNSVDLASLRATDKIQKDLEEYLAKHDWYYDRRKNYYKNQGKSADRIVSASYLGAAVRALALRSPSLASEQQTRWMKQEKDYKRIFNPAWDLRVFLICLEICRLIDPFLRNRERPVGTVRGIDGKKSKYIVGLVYLAKVFENINYTADDIAELKAYPVVDDIKSIVAHINKCYSEYFSEKQNRKRVTNSYDKFANYILRELERNQYEYFPFEEIAEGSNDATLYPTKTDKSEFYKNLRTASDAERERKFQEAIEILESCLNINLPDRQLSILHYNIARVYSRLNKNDTALTHYENALELGMNTSNLYGSLARALYKTNGDKKVIQDYFEEAIELDDTNAYAHNWYATFLKSINEWRRARESAQHALRLQPKNSTFLYNLALIIIEQNPSKDDMLQAKELLEKAVELASVNYPYPAETLDKVNKMLIS